jgi:hypothetical protein
VTIVGTTGEMITSSIYGRPCEFGCRQLMMLHSVRATPAASRT